ncbi:UbiD family decarboxylase [Thermodesulfobacteriota bacterium]
MYYRDLRDWIQALEKEGDLLRIKEEVKLEPDVGAIGRAVCDVEGPGIFIENPSGIKTPLTICLHASWRRAAMAMGLPKESTRSEQIQAWIDAYKRYPVKSKMVNDAPCKETVLTGDEVNIFQFPIPRCNFNDASFYLVKTVCISKDPDTGWVNVGMYRMMLLNRNRIAIMVSTAAAHFRQHWRKWHEKGKKMEVAVALGTEPVLPMVAGMRIPAEWNEFDYAGAVRNEPEELVKAETVDLPVPARAEIVLEGVLNIDTPVLEGPFGEHPGSYSSYYWAPVFEVKAITHRNNPINDTLFCGRPPSEANYMTMLSKVAGVQEELKRMMPQITEIAFHYPYLYNVVIQGKWGHNGEPKRAMFALWGASFGTPMKQVTIVDEDIDPWDASQVSWAVCTRCQANEDIVMVPGCDPVLDPAREEDYTNCKLGIDATKARPPFYRHKHVDWIYPGEGTEEWKEKILKQWERR